MERLYDNGMNNIQLATVDRLAENLQKTLRKAPNNRDALTQLSLLLYGYLTKPLAKATNPNPRFALMTHVKLITPSSTYSTSTTSTTTTTPPEPNQQPEDTAAKPKPKATKAPAAAQQKRNSVVVKVGMVGDAQIGKTSLMVKYIEGKFDEDYIQTLGVNFMEKSITIKNTEITFSIWDLGGQREFISMLPLVCNDAVATLFMFDLSNKASLSSVKDWYRQVRGMNRNSFAFLIGTKYDLFVELSNKEQAAITKQARKFAKAMKAPLIFSSASHSINIQKIFKIVLSKVFNLKCNIPCVSTLGDPILEH
jgi:GTP-binding protein of the ras superfamily involved in termination of M-phase